MVSLHCYKEHKYFMLRVDRTMVSSKELYIPVLKAYQQGLSTSKEECHCRWNEVSFTADPELRKGSGFSRESTNTEALTK